MVNDPRYSITARVCACVGLFAGATVDDAACVMGLSVRRMRDVFPALMRLGCVSQVNDGHLRRYHLLRAGRRLVDVERMRVAGECLALVGRAKSVTGAFPRLELLQQMEDELRKTNI